MTTSNAAMYQPHRGVNDTGLLDFVVSFTTNGSSDPDTTTFRGNHISTVTYGATGIYTVTFDESCVYIDDLQASLDDKTSSADGAYATVVCADEEASPLVFYVYTWNASGSATAYTGRRIRVRGLLKQSMAGKTGGITY